jgi:hypothetical protein
MSAVTLFFIQSQPKEYSTAYNDMQAKENWDQVYKTTSIDSVSWFQEHVLCSLQLIHQTCVELSAMIIDVGGGASTLVNDLLSEGYCGLTVMDISAVAIAAAFITMVMPVPRPKCLMGRQSAGESFICKISKKGKQPDVAGLA